jgi:hypothetical protein
MIGVLVGYEQEPDIGNRVAKRSELDFERAKRFRRRRARIHQRQGLILDQIRVYITNRKGRRDEKAMNSCGRC